MRKYSNASIIGKIIDILDHRFKGAWHEKDFVADDHDACDSINSVNEIVELLRQYDSI